MADPGLSHGRLARWVRLGTKSYVSNRWPGQPAPVGPCQVRMSSNQPFRLTGPRKVSARSGSIGRFAAMFGGPRETPRRGDPERLHSPQQATTQIHEKAPENSQISLRTSGRQANPLALPGRCSLPPSRHPRKLDAYSTPRRSRGTAQREAVRLRACPLSRSLLPRKVARGSGCSGYVHGYSPGQSTRIRIP